MPTPWEIALILIRMQCIVLFLKQSVRSKCQLILNVRSLTIKTLNQAWQFNSVITVSMEEGNKRIPNSRTQNLCVKHGAHTGKAHEGILFLWPSTLSWKFSPCGSTIQRVTKFWLTSNCVLLCNRGCPCPCPWVWNSLRITQVSDHLKLTDYVSRNALELALTFLQPHFWLM